MDRAACASAEAGRRVTVRLAMHVHASRATRQTPPAQPASSPAVRRSPSAAQTSGARCACGGRCPRCTAATAVAHAQALTATVRPALESSSHPLAAEDRERMERSFGRDFGAVRLHTGAGAAHSAERLAARAYTIGNDIVFGAGEYRRGTESTARLLAHELAHVAQTGNLGSSSQSMRLGSPGDPEERWARRASDAVGSGSLPGPVPSATAQHAVVRRSHKFQSPPTVYENLAELVLLNTSKVAVALALLNGTRIAGGPPNELAEMQTAARGAIKPPEIKVEPKGPPGSEMSTVRATVKHVRANDGGAEVSLLTPPPWTSVRTRGEVNRLLGLTRCSGPDTCVVRALGKPTDQDYGTAIRQHEGRHAADNQTAFETTVAPWDDKLTEAHRIQREFVGTLAQVKAALWGAMGGTPDDIANAYAKAVLDRGQAYHASETHPQSVARNAQLTSPDCSTATFDVEPTK